MPQSPKRQNWLILGATMLLGVVLGQSILSIVGGRRVVAADPRDVTPRGELREDEKLNIKLFHDTSPSVVFITTRQRRQDFQLNVQEVEAGSGSGFFWDEQGHVVTNYHVVYGASSFLVTLNDQTRHEAKLIGVSPSNDLAVLKLNDAPETKLRPLALGTSADLAVGQSVLAIGNPFGLDQTLTTGIVSALGRTIQSPVDIPIDDVIQTDAAINPGNSGGPLLDSAGRLIGVNTAIRSQSGGSVGVGFAVPVDTVNRIVPQLIANGAVTRAVIGVKLIDPRNNAAAMARLQVNGVMVLGVLPNGGAEAAGLRGTSVEGRQVTFGDVLLEVAGRPVRNAGDLYAALARFNPGQSVEAKVWRDGKERKVQIKLQAGQE